MNLKTMTERDLLRAALNELYHNQLVPARDAKERTEAALQRTKGASKLLRRGLTHYTDRVTKLESQCAELRALLQNTTEEEPTC